MRVPARPLEDYAGLSTPSTRVPGAAFLRSSERNSARHFRNSHDRIPSLVRSRATRADRREELTRWTPTRSPLLATEPGRAAIAHAMARLDAGAERPGGRRGRPAPASPRCRQASRLPPSSRRRSDAAAGRSSATPPTSMWFTADGLEQATSAIAAHHRATRFGAAERHSGTPAQGGRLVLRDRRRSAGAERPPAAQSPASTTTRSRRSRRE